MASLAKRFPLAQLHRMASLAKRFPPAYWTLYVVLGKSLPTCLLYIVWRPWQSASIPTCLLDIVCCPWQSASLLPIGHRIAFLAERFPLAYWTSYGVLGKALQLPLAYWTSYGVLGKALPTICRLDIVCRPWQSASHLLDTVWFLLKF